jgi:hypothetical protein
MLRNPLGCGKSPLGRLGRLDSARIGAGSPRDAAYTAVIRSLLRQSPRTLHDFSDQRSAQQHSLQNRRGIAGQVDVELEGMAHEDFGIIAEYFQPQSRFAVAVQIAGQYQRLVSEVL